MGDTVLTGDAIRYELLLGFAPADLSNNSNGDDDESVQRRWTYFDILRHAVTDISLLLPFSFFLTVKYPASYPDTTPDLELAIDPASSRGFLDFPANMDSILESLSSTIEENQGIAMVFTLVTRRAAYSATA